MAEQSPEQAIVHSRNVAGGALVEEPNLMQVGSIFHLRSFEGGEVHSSLAADPLTHGRAFPTSGSMKHSLLQTSAIVHERVIQLSAARWASGVYIRSDTPAYPVRIVDQGDDSIVTFQVAAAGDLELAGDLTLTGGGTIRTAPSGYRAEMSAGSYPFRYFNSVLPSLVQKASAFSNSATVITPVFGAATLAGNLIIAVAAVEETVGTRTIAITSLGATWLALSTVTNTTGKLRNRIWWHIATGGQVSWDVSSSLAGPIVASFYEFDMQDVPVIHRQPTHNGISSGTVLEVTDAAYTHPHEVGFAVTVTTGTVAVTDDPEWTNQHDVVTGGTNPLRVTVATRFIEAPEILHNRSTLASSDSGMLRVFSWEGPDNRFSVDDAGGVQVTKLVVNNPSLAGPALSVTHGGSGNVLEALFVSGSGMKLENNGVLTSQGFNVKSLFSDANAQGQFSGSGIRFGSSTTDLMWVSPDTTDIGIRLTAVGAAAAPYLSFQERTAPPTPPSNLVRIYAKDKSGVSNLYWKNDAGTEYDLSATGGGGAHDHTTADGSGVLTNDEHDGYMELSQIASPSTPGSNKIRMYAKDDGGTAKLFIKREDGVEVGPYAGTNIVNNWSGKQQFVGISTDQGWSAFITGDAEDRIRARHDGRFMWGDGTNAPDAGIEWSAANLLKMVAGDSFLFGSTLRLDTGDFIESGEITAPSSPAADKVRLYVRPRGNATGVSKLEVKDTTGAVRDLAGSAYVVGPLTADTGPSNTTTEWDLIAYTVPANDLEVGATYRFWLSGTLDNIATSGNITLRLRFGSTLIENIVLATQASAKTDSPFWIEAYFTCRTTGATGTAHGSIYQRNAFTASTTSAQSTAPVTVDTTASTSLRFTVQWQTANAGNIWRTMMGYIERVK